MIKEYITFPENEYEAYEERLNKGKTIYTTRVSSEVNKYKLDNIYDSHFGNLKVTYLRHFEDINDHPFLSELTNEQIKEINNYIQEFGYDIIGLEKAK